MFLFECRWTYMKNVRNAIPMCVLTTCIVNFDWLKERTKRSLLVQLFRNRLGTLYFSSHERFDKFPYLNIYLPISIRWTENPMRSSCRSTSKISNLPIRNYDRLGRTTLTDWSSLRRIPNEFQWRNRNSWKKRQAIASVSVLIAMYAYYIIFVWWVFSVHTQYATYSFSPTIPWNAVVYTCTSPSRCRCVFALSTLTTTNQMTTKNTPKPNNKSETLISTIRFFSTFFFISSFLAPFACVRALYTREI